ncbi:MAG: lipocalin family protein [Verrucomicrobiota bacterium]
MKIQDFMGAWFVHGYTPILVDKAAHNAVEHYYLNAKNEVETTYRFRDGSFTGKLKTYTPTGFPKKDDPSGALWQMQFIWPFKADYVIIYVSEDYQSTIIGHPNRKYAWIMDRSSEIEDETYNALLVKLEDAGYDTSIIKRLPQDWSEETERLERLNAIGADGPLVAR